MWTSVSKSLLRNERHVTGLKLLKSSLFLFGFKMGVTTPVFSLSGKIPCWRELLIKTDKYGATTSEMCLFFIYFVSIGSNWHVFFFNFDIVVKILFCDINSNDSNLGT